MKKNKLSNQKWYNNAVAVLIGVVSYVALTNLGTIVGALKSFSGYFTAVFIGCVIAYMVNPLASFMEENFFQGLKKQPVRWMLSVIVAMLVLILLLMCLMLMLIPQLIESISLLVGNMDGYIRTLEGMIANWNIAGIDLSEQLNEFMASSEDLIKTGTQLLTSSLSRILAASKGIGKNLLNLLLALILSIYLLGAKDSLKQGSRRLLKASMSDQWYDVVVTFLKRCNNILVRYIIFSILDAAIVGGANAFFMAIVGMQYVGLISVVVGVTNLIPSFGPMIGAVIGGFILLLVNPWHALIFLVFTAVLQTLDGYVIKPKLFGDSLGVSGFLILIAIIVFGNIWGIWGILLAIPLAAIIDFTYEEYFLPHLEARKARMVEEEEREQRKAAQKLEKKGDKAEEKLEKKAEAAEEKLAQETAKVSTAEAASAQETAKVSTAEAASAQADRADEQKVQE